MCVSSSPLISVITVCRNAAVDLCNTAASVLSQNYVPIEYIIIDGASTDDTAQQIERIREQCAQRGFALHTLSEPDQGIYDAMNKGVGLAKGEWICFMNAGDCFSQPDIVHQVFAENAFSDDCAVIYGNVWLQKSFGRVEMKPKPIDYLQQRMAFCHQACFVRRLQALSHPFDLHYRVAADYAFFYQLYHEGAHFVYRDLPIAIFESESGISSRQKNAVRCECARINGADQTIRWQLQHLGMKVSDFLKSLLNNIIPNGLRERVRQANYERLARRRLSQS